MAGTMSIDGLVSGLNTTQLVEQLVSLERAPITHLETRKSKLQAQNDAWREINSCLYSLRQAALDLQSILTFRGRSATVTGDNILTAAAGTGTQKGVYNIKVLQLAQAHSIGSDPQTTAGGPLGLSGTIRINDVEIEITAGDTLESIARKINTQAEAGVNAVVVRVGDEDFRLILTAVGTGEANQIKLEDDGDVLAALGFLDSKGEIKNQLQAAEDALLEINGLAVSRSTNVIKDLITDVTLELKTEGTATLTLDVDMEKVVKAVEKFVNEYNGFMDLIRENLAYDTKTKEAGTLFGDSTLVHIEAQLRSFLSRVVPGVDPAVNQLGLVGIQTASGVEGAKSGRLEFNAVKFREKLETHFSEIAKLFGAETVPEGEGVFAALSKTLFDWTSSTGLIKAKTDSLGASIEDVDERIEVLEQRLAQREEYYMQKFIALETMLAQLQTQSNWLSAQLSTLNSQWGFR
jgi:flagellar hook-associated protein 2